MKKNVPTIDFDTASPELKGAKSLLESQKDWDERAIPISDRKWCRALNPDDPLRQARTLIENHIKEFSQEHPKFFIKWPALKIWNHKNVNKHVWVRLRITEQEDIPLRINVATSKLTQEHVLALYADPHQDSIHDLYAAKGGIVVKRRVIKTNTYMGGSHMPPIILKLMIYFKSEDAADPSKKTDIKVKITYWDYNEGQGRGQCRIMMAKLIDDKLYYGKEQVTFYNQKHMLESAFNSIR